MTLSSNIFSSITSSWWGSWTLPSLLLFERAFSTFSFEFVSEGGFWTVSPLFSSKGDFGTFSSEGFSEEGCRTEAETGAGGAGDGKCNAWTLREGLPGKTGDFITPSSWRG